MEKKKSKILQNAVKTAAFLVILFLLLYTAQRVLVKHFKYPIDAEDHSGRAVGFDELPENSLDVLFLGTSHAMYAVSPLTIYKEEGIVSYNLATSLQTLDVSYALLMRAFLTQSPKVVMLDISNLYLDYFYDSSWRWAVDHQKLDLGKLKIAREYERSYTGNSSLMQSGSIQEFLALFEKKATSAFSLLFPLYYYHSRWNELGKYDFTNENRKTYSMGFNMMTFIKEALSVEEMNRIAEELSSEQVLYVDRFNNEAHDQEARTAALYSAEIPEASIFQLERIKKLCEEHNAELVLFKVPAISDPREYSSAWTELRSSQVHTIASNMELDFVDLLYDTDEIWDTDRFSMDGGMHCNYVGAKQVSECIGQYLKNEYGLQAHSNDRFDKCLPYYERITDAAVLETTTDINRYFDILWDMRDSVEVLMTGNGDISGCNTPDGESADNPYRYPVSISAEYAGKAFAAIMTQDNVEFQFSDTSVSVSRELSDGTPFSLYSAGDTLTSDGMPNGEIKIDGNAYEVNEQGLNIVVRDRETGCVIDSVTFSPDDEGRVAAVRNSTIIIFKEFEHTIYEIEEKETGS